MNWQDYLALLLFVAATAFVAWRVWRALSGKAKAGCGSGCGSCGKSDATATRAPQFLSISTSNETRPQ